MNCRDYHATKQDPHCPYCVVACLLESLRTHDPNDPAITPAVMLLDKARRSERQQRLHECRECDGLGVIYISGHVSPCKTCKGEGML